MSYDPLLVSVRHIISALIYWRLCNQIIIALVKAKKFIERE